MSATPECLGETIIGLSRTDCECYGTPPADFDVTDSGLYLDETPGLNLDKIFSAANCSKDGWAIMERAREGAIKSFTNEVLMGVRQGVKPKRQPGRSTIGGSKGTKDVSLNKTYHGIDLVLASHVGGTATINRIGTAMKFTGNVTVGIYDREGLKYTRIVSAIANQQVWTDIDPLVLDMGGNTSDNPRYWFLFQPTPGQQALSYAIASCGCQGKPKWSQTFGGLESAVTLDGQNWTAWAIASGTYGSDFTTIENWGHANEAQGLMLDIEFKCDTRTVMCSGSPDYAQDPIQFAIATGIRIAAALDIISQVTGSTRVIRENIVGGDEMELLRVGLQKDKGDLIAYLVEVFTSDDGINTYSDCFTCNGAYSVTAKTMRR